MRTGGEGWVMMRSNNDANYYASFVFFCSVSRFHKDNMQVILICSPLWTVNIIFFQLLAFVKG